jgi:hypothetical protein
MAELAWYCKILWVVFEFLREILWAGNILDFTARYGLKSSFLDSVLGILELNILLGWPTF